MTTTHRLTGPYDIERLESIASDPVTIAVSWSALEGFETPVREGLEAMAHAITHHTGSLGVALLEPGEGGNEFHVVARFSSGVELRDWEESDERRELLARLTPYVDAVNVAATHSPEAFFAALVGTSRARKHHRFVLDLLWFLPASFTVSWLLGPFEHGWWLGARVLAGSIAVSGVYAIFLGPVRSGWRAWRNRRAPLR